LAGLGLTIEQSNGDVTTTPMPPADGADGLVSLAAIDFGDTDADANIAVFQDARIAGGGGAATQSLTLQVFSNGPAGAADLTGTATSTSTETSAQVTADVTFSAAFSVAPPPEGPFFGLIFFNFGANYPQNVGNNASAAASISL
jgi:hypothetical protein